MRDACGSTGNMLTCPKYTSQNGLTPRSDAAIMTTVPSWIVTVST